MRPYLKPLIAVGCFLAVALASFTLYATETVPGRPDYDHFTEDWTPAQLEQWMKSRQENAEINSSSRTHSQKCLARWSLIWELAKIGNLQSRLDLYIGLGQQWIEIVGRPNDRLSRIRDGMALYFYMLGSPDSNGEKPYFSVMRTFGISGEFSKTFEENEPLRECLKQELSQRCTKIAIEHKLIPTFEQYAAEIDMYLKQGATIECME